MKIRFLFWDAGEVPLAGDLEKAVFDVYNHRNLPSFVYVPNPDWDK